ncbi:alpha/beta fold hydrolase [Blastopirellula sp. JC732]|uniref:Alpha/beta fold hydrolase n=1 Tax=Blastopirellula sediminis TaxID=2894196 RepID=A0A9X1MJD8_9BACT|nr:alpha/beta hydrolase [Blastopirellula sediminis]MCC9609035.1 alpha/beta fold hydrolase [Blastopirellula sediminis]MCC9628188.1 alpha/beta fold hydrolase [Blastopirellula sediminis]
MAQIRTQSAVEIEYDTFGSQEDPALLLIMGFGAQMIGWSAPFCQRLADAGRFVIRFDNRDCGLSSKMHGQQVDLNQVIAKLTAGDLAAARELAPYSIEDMAGDAIGLLDGLELHQAHIVGSSMGGVIAQIMAIEHPERVLTLTSMMSTTGEPDVGQSSPEAMRALFTPSPSDREGFIQASIKSAVWRSKKYYDPDEVRKNAAASYDRSYYPEGAARQIAALITNGSRAARLKTMLAPTLVIHGLEDTLIAPSGGERTAELAPNARLLLLEDMGHDRPEPLWPQICGAIIEHTASETD